MMNLSRSGVTIDEATAISMIMSTKINSFLCGKA